MKVNAKDIPNKYNSLGQYFTPLSVVDFCLDRTKIETDLIVEPSCGDGAFLTKIRERWNTKVIGIEVDKDVIKDDDVLNINFYDFETDVPSITFIGNVPFRTPACSLTDSIYGRYDYVRSLAKKYEVTGIREEAVFFIMKSVDLIKNGHIYYILPKNIFHNNSRSYKTFMTFLKNNVRLAEVWDIGQEFEKVNTDLCYVHFVVDGSRSEEFLLNGKPALVDDFYGVNEDIIPFQRIFKKTYLGSVPCESVLLSVRDEPLEHFKQRLYRLIKNEINEDNLIEHLSYNDVVHLVSLKKKDVNKIKVVLGYVNEIKRLISADDFLDVNYYKPIQHRHEVRHYFRHDKLKKAKFLYQLNPHPCRSFYFPGNIASGCLDYHGWCEYDVNRNCSPSANRTVPVEGIEDNLTDEFKVYCNDAKLPYDKVFDYLSYVLESDWYKMMKNKYQRWYFGVPMKFMKEWNE